MYGSIEDYTYDPTALIEVSDILGNYIMKLTAIISMYMCVYILI